MRLILVLLAAACAAPLQPPRALLATLLQARDARAAMRAFGSGEASAEASAEVDDYDYYDVSYTYDYTLYGPTAAEAALIEQVRIIACQLSRLTPSEQALAEANALPGMPETWAKWCAEHDGALDAGAA